MTGHWTHRDVDVHRCALPTMARQSDGTYAKRLDRWKCDDCNKEYIVTKVNSDQREGDYLSWEEFESWKSGPFPPGSK